MADNKSSTTNNIEIAVTPATITVWLACEHEFDFSMAIPSVALENGEYCPICKRMHDLDNVDPGRVHVTTKDMAVDHRVDGEISAIAYAEYHPASGTFNGTFITTPDDFGFDVECEWADIIAGNGDKGEDE